MSIYFRDTTLAWLVWLLDRIKGAPAKGPSADLLNQLDKTIGLKAAAARAINRRELFPMLRKAAFKSDKFLVDVGKIRKSFEESIT